MRISVVCSVRNVFSLSRSLHRTFLSGLRAKFEAWDDVQQISDVFLELTPYFKLYTQYCMNYDNAIATLQAEKQVNEPFKFFLSVRSLQCHVLRAQ